MLKLDHVLLKKMLQQVGREEILSRFCKASGRKKSDGSLVTEADIQTQARLKQALGRHWPDWALLGEEMTAEAQAQVLNNEPIFWVLDPLDGTTNYAHGLPFFSISLALVISGRIHFGMVYDPYRDECFWAEAGQGAWLNGLPLRLPSDQNQALCDCIAVVDYKRLDPDLACHLVRERRFQSQRNLGSVALEWCWLAADRAQLYLHGGQKLWDYAAGRLIFQEAGGALVEPDADCLTLGVQRAVAAANGDLLVQWAQLVT